MSKLRNWKNPLLALEDVKDDYHCIYTIDDAQDLFDEIIKAKKNGKYGIKCVRDKININNINILISKGYNVYIGICSQSYSNGDIDYCFELEILWKETYMNNIFRRLQKGLIDDIADVVMDFIYD